MSSGLLYGLGAALAWGLTDVTAALGGRRYGSLRVVVVTQTLGVATLVAIQVVALLAGAPAPDLDLWSVAVAGLCGLFACVAYLAFFTALRIGPITVVSPTVSAYGGLTVVLAVVLRGESMTALQAVGALVATLGVTFVGLTFAEGIRSIRVVGPGVLFGIVALVGFATLTVTMADPIRTIGWLPALIISRGTNAALGAALLSVALGQPWGWAEPFLAVRARPSPRGRLRSPATAVILAGLLDVAGLVSYGIGLETSAVWLVGLASSFGPVAAVIVAVLFLGERPRPIQWLGIVAIAAGIILIGLDRSV
jgi:drug/metabolite transporter (DMT)-like permease